MLSIQRLLTEYYNNKAIIKDYLQKRENYGDGSDRTIMGMGLAIFLVIFIIAIIIWIWALVALISNWKKLPNYAKIIGTIGILPILPFGPVVTLLAVYIGRQK